MLLPDYLRKAGVEIELPAPVLDILDSVESINVQEDMSAHRMSLGQLQDEELVELMISRVRWLEWRETRLEINTARDDAGKELLPLELVETTLVSCELGLLDRAVDSADSCAGPLIQALRATIELCLKGSKLQVGAPKKKHIRADSNKQLHCEVDDLATLDAKNWLAIVRAANEGSVSMTWTHPTDEIQKLCQATLTQAEADLGRRKDTTVIRELILDHLDADLSAEKSRLAKEALMAQAAREYAEMLNADPVGKYPVGGIYIGTDKQRVGLAALDKRGNVVTTAPVRPSGDWSQRVHRWLQDNRVRVAVIPSSASAGQWLEEVSSTLIENEDDHVVVSPAGLFAARGADDPVLRRVSPEIASAIVLARRAMQPIEAWSRVEPAKLGLVPMSAGISDDHLTELLLMVREGCLAGSMAPMTAPVGEAGIRPRSNASLNPTVRGIRDLRPGLNLNGVVSNITKFGAFVNVGVRQEGLVHISELSHDFVEDPNEVVKVGAQVQVRVISVDLERGRIALTMRTETSRPAGGGPGGGGMSQQRLSATDGPGRSQALMDLESLFKKSPDEDGGGDVSDSSDTE